MKVLCLKAKFIYKLTVVVIKYHNLKHFMNLLIKYDLSYILCEHIDYGIAALIKKLSLLTEKN